MKILVVGGQGHIGSNLISKVSKENINNVAITFKGDITDINDIIANFVIAKSKDVDTVVHLGAIMSSPSCDAAQQYAFDVNVKGTFNVAKATKENEMKFVYIASTSSYLPTSEIITENSEKTPFTLYGLTKDLGEQVAKFVFKDELLSLCLCHCYGKESDWYSIISNIVKNSYINRPTIVHINPRSLRSWLYIDDCVNAIIASIDKKLKGSYNISSHDYRQFGEITNIVIKYGLRPIIYWRAENDYMANHRVDSSKFRDATSWAEQISIEQGVKELVDIYKNNLLKGGPNA